MVKQVTLWEGNNIRGTAFAATSQARGWYTATFAFPVPVSVGRTYTASYSTRGGYALVRHDSWPKNVGMNGATAVSGKLRSVPALTVKHRVQHLLAARRGVWISGYSVPTKVFKESNYYVDIGFFGPAGSVNGWLVCRGS